MDYKSGFLPVGGFGHLFAHPILATNKIGRDAQGAPIIHPVITTDLA